LRPKHLDRYIQDFAERHNLRDLESIDETKAVGTGMRGKQLRYKDLIAANSLACGARS